MIVITEIFLAISKAEFQTGIVAFQGFAHDHLKYWTVDAPNTNDIVELTRVDASGSADAKRFGGHCRLAHSEKIVCQFDLVAGTLAAVCEGLLLGAKAGVDLDKVFQAVTGGAANSWQLENLGSRILKRDFDPGFAVKLMLKDQRLINEASQEMELPMPVSAVARQFFYLLGQRGLGEEGTQSYIKGLEEMAGVVVKGNAG